MRVPLNDLARVVAPCAAAATITFPAIVAIVVSIPPPSPIARRVSGA